MDSFIGLLKKSITYRDSIRRFWKLRTKCQNSKSKVLRKIYYFKYIRMSEKKGASIPIAADIDACPVFPHGINGIFISCGAKIGKGCTIFHQVTIGSNTLPDSKNHGFPTVGDNVYIGAGAKIIGAVKIGNNVRIGANCVVVTDVPDNATVVSAPAKIIENREKRSNKFVSYESYTGDTLE